MDTSKLSESHEHEHAHIKCCQAITRQDLEVINQRLGALEAQIHRSEAARDIRDKTTIHGDDVRMNVGYRDKVRRKPIKSSSFSDRSSTKSHRRSPYRHTVPSGRGVYYSIRYIEHEFHYFGIRRKRDLSLSLSLSLALSL